MWARRPRAEVDLEALYRAHFGLVWALVGRYGVRPSHREDVVQEVWLTVHRRLASFDTSLSAAHWIAGVARFVAWRHIRTMMRAHRKLEALRALARVDDDSIVDHETVAFVGAALDSLEPIFRDAITSVELEGWSGPEAAERLGLPVNTLYSRLRIAKRRLRETLIELEAVEHSETTAPVPDDAGGLQSLRSQSDTFATHAQEVREFFGFLAEDPRAGGLATLRTETVRRAVDGIVAAFGGDPAHAREVVARVRPAFAHMHADERGRPRLAAIWSVEGLKDGEIVLREVQTGPPSAIELVAEA